MRMPGLVRAAASLHCMFMPRPAIPIVLKRTEGEFIHLSISRMICQIISRKVSSIREIAWIITIPSPTHKSSIRKTSSRIRGWFRRFSRVGWARRFSIVARVYRSTAHGICCLLPNSRQRNSDHRMKITGPIPTSRRQ